MAKCNPPGPVRFSGSRAISKEVNHMAKCGSKATPAKTTKSCGSKAGKSSCGSKTGAKKK